MMKEQSSRNKTAPDMPLIDISIVTFNSARWLKDFFESLGKQHYPLDRLNILIRDNGSTDNTCAVLEDLRSKWNSGFAGFTTEVGDNIGFGCGHNVNLSKAIGKFFLVTNVDLRFEADTLTVLVGTALSDNDRVAGWECRQKPFEHPKIYHPATLETTWSSSACMLFRRTTLTDIGGYEPRLFLYGEDVELSYRLRDNGFVLRYVPKAVCWHYTYENADQIKPAQFFGSTLANTLLRFRYGSLREILIALTMYASLWLLPQRVPRQRAGLLRNGLQIVTKGPYFLLTRKKNCFSFPFRLWDYELARDGAFYSFRETSRVQPLVSVLIRTMQGRGGMLREAVCSVQNQTYPHIELVVVEDGSDSAREYVESIARSGTLDKITYLSLPKSGRCKAGNKALAAASGEFLCFLDDDDLFYADHLEVLVAELTERPTLGAAYSLAFQVESDIISYEPYEYKDINYSVIYRQRFSRPILWHHNYIPIQAIVFRRELYETYGGFDEELDNLEDWNLWVRYSQRHDFQLVEKVTSLYRVPTCPKRILERQKVLDDYYSKATAKHEQLHFNVTPGEVIRLAMELAQQQFIVTVPRAKLRRILLKLPMAGRLFYFLQRLGAWLRRR